jgi:hypothetical protein
MSGNTPYLENKQPMFKTQQEYDRYIKYIKHSYKINRDNLNLAKFLLKWMGLPIVDAPCEADSQCAAIASMYNDKVIGVLTDDFDPIMHMSINIIKLQNLHSNYFHKYTLNNILLNIENKANSIIRNSTDIELKSKYTNDIKITYNNLVEIGCLLGTDYCNGLKCDNKQKNNIETILLLYIKHDMNIHTLLSSLEYVTPVYVTKLLNTVNIYKEATIIDPATINTQMVSPNINMIKYICRDFIEPRSLNNAISIMLNIYNIVSNNGMTTRLRYNEYSLPRPKFYSNIATISV